MTVETHPAAGRVHTAAAGIWGFVMEQAIGDTLDAMGMRLDLDDGDLISSAVLVAAILVPGDDNPRLTIASTDGMSWINQAGLLRLAERITSEPPDMGDE